MHLSSAKTWRGGEQQIAYLAEELRRAGFVQWIFCAKDSQMENWCLRNDFPHLTFHKIASVNPVTALKISYFCNRLGITQLHAHDAHSHTSAFLSAILFHNKTPLIVSRRVDFPIGKGFFSKWKYNHKALKKIICVSRFIKKTMSPDIQEPEKLIVVHSGIDTSKFSAHTLPKDKKNTLRHTYNIAPHELLIANIAAIAPHKDYFTFVNTAAMLLKKGLPARFLLIGGDGGEEETIRQFIYDKGLENQVIMTGFQNNVPAILPELDLLLFTSKTEGLGTTLLDAMAARVPIVATQGGGIPEIVEHNNTGLTAPVGDAAGLAEQVWRLFHENGLRGALVENGRRKVLDFTKEKMANGVGEVYKSLG